MKKIFSGVSIMFILLTIVLAGCSDAYDLKGNLTGSTDVTKTETVPSLKAPGNVKAVNEYDGLIRLTWDPVADAKNYAVYRRDSSNNTSVALTTVLSKNICYYDDLAGFDNQLKAGITYTYVIIAYSGQSTARIALNDDVIWNGESAPVSITPTKMPAIGTDMPAVSGISTRQTVLEGADVLYVLWDAIPTAKYSIKYSFGTTAGEGIDPSTDYAYDDTDLNATVLVSKYRDAQKGVVIFPLIGGKNTIQISASYQGGENYYNTVTGKETEQYALTVLDTPADFTAARTAGSSNLIDKNDVILEWTAVDGATNYDLYRAQISGNEKSIIGDWTAVTPSFIEQYANASDTKWRATDKDVLKSNNYKYMVIAKNTAGKSLPALASTTISNIAYAAPAFTPTVRNVITGSGQSAVLNAVVDISWDSNTGETYKLSRAVVTYDSGITPGQYTEPSTIGDYEDIPGISLGEIAGKAVVIDTPEKRYYYRYRLIAERGGVQSEPRYYNLTTAPFADRTDLKLEAESHPTIPFAIALTLTDQSPYSDDIATPATIKIYRRETTAPQTAYIDTGLTISLPDKTEAGYEPSFTPAITVPADVRGYDNKDKEYQYKAVIVIGTGNDAVTMENLSADNISNTGIAVSDGPSITALTLGTPNLNGAGGTRQITVNFTGEHLETARMAYQYRSSNTGSSPTDDDPWSSTGTIIVQGTDPYYSSFNLPNNTNNVTIYDIRVRPINSTNNNDWKTINIPALTP